MQGLTVCLKSSSNQHMSVDHMQAVRLWFADANKSHSPDLDTKGWNRCNAFWCNDTTCNAYMRCCSMQTRHQK